MGIDFEKTRALARTIMSEVTVKLVGLLEINIDKQRLDSTHIFSDMVSFGRKARRWHTLRPLLGYFTVGAWERTLEDSRLASNSIQSQPLFANPAKSIVTGEYGTYSIEYDPSTWVLQREVSNKDSEYEFHHSNGDAYAMLIYEKIQIPLNVLETAAIENLESAASDVKVLSREIIQLGDKTILSIQCEATITKVPVVYRAYLSSGEQGTLQFVTGISKYSFDEYQHDCQTLLRGLNLASYEPPEAIENINKADFNDLIEIAEKRLEPYPDVNE